MYFNRQTRLSLVHREISSPTTDYIAAAAAATAAAALLPNDLYLHLRRMYKYHFVSECFDIDFIVDDMDRKFFKVLFSPVHSLHSLLPPVKSWLIRTGSALETTTFSSQSATVLVASLLL